MIILCHKKVADVCICLTCEARVNSAKGTTTNMMKHLRHRESKVVCLLSILKACNVYKSAKDSDFYAASLRRLAFGLAL